MSLNENIFLYSVPNFSKHKKKLINYLRNNINGLFAMTKNLSSRL